MARIYPFRAIRYNPSLVRVEDCVTQPYDKITPSMQAGYYARSPYNLVRVILGLPELFDQPGIDDVYTRAARDFDEWRRTGVLAQESEPCLFAYSQRFNLPAGSGSGNSETGERRGLIALGAVSPYSEGIVFRHEQTHTRARSDRLSLLRATRAHFGQIFMLYSDPARTVETLLFPAGADTRIPDIEVEDEFGTLHRVWKVADAGVINMIQGALGDKKLIIADGHHRYETALAYAAEHTPAGRAHTIGSAQQPPFPEAAVMMTLINMDGTMDGAAGEQMPEAADRARQAGGNGLRILPTHRIIAGLEAFSVEAFASAAADLFSSVEPLSIEPGQGDALIDELRKATAKAPAGSTVLLAVTRKKAFALTMDRDAHSRALPSISERRRQLDMVVLHEAVLPRLLGIEAEAVAAGRYVSYAREVAEALEPVLRGDAQLAFLVNPVTLAQLRENTFAGEVMPQKSTDFYPKLLSGLTIYALDHAPGTMPGHGNGTVALSSPLSAPPSTTPNTSRS